MSFDILIKVAGGIKLPFSFFKRLRFSRQVFTFIVISFAVLSFSQNCAQSYDIKTIPSQAVTTYSVPELPKIEIILRPGDLSNDVESAFKFSTTIDPNAKVVSSMCQLNNRPTFDCSSGAFSVEADEGSNQLTIIVTDSYGQKVESSKIFFTIDRTAPMLTINKRPTEVSAFPTAEILYSASDSIRPASEIELYCSENLATSFVKCGNSKNYSGLVDGNYSLRIKAKDRAGNFSATQEINWEVDLTVPGVQITSAPSSFTNLREATIKFEGSDNKTIEKFQCRFNDSSWSDCSSPTDLKDLKDGIQKFEVRSLDKAGNASQGAVANWTVDLIKPTTPTISQNFSGTYSKLTDVSFALSSIDSGSGLKTLECRINAAEFAACTSPLNKRLTVGEYTLEVRALDLAENRSDSNKLLFVVDNLPPEIPTVTTTFLADSKNVESNALFEFNALDIGPSGINYFSCNLNGKIFSPCVSPTEFKNFIEGQNTLSVTVFDRAGNSSAKNFRWTLDPCSDIQVKTYGLSFTTSISNDRMYMFYSAGAYPDYFTAARAYRIADRSWEELNIKINNFCVYESLSLSDGRIAILGGQSCVSSSPDAYIFDPKNQTFKHVPIPRGSTSDHRIMLASGTHMVEANSELLFWSGNLYQLNHGFRYNLNSGLFTPIATVNSPNVRNGSFIWTGSKLIVWGGDDENYGTGPGYYNFSRPRADGAMYNPQNNTWEKIPAPANFEGRTRHLTAWTGQEIVIWGGLKEDQACNIDNMINACTPTAAAFNPETKTWRLLADSNGKGWFNANGFIDESGRLQILDGQTQMLNNSFWNNLTRYEFDIQNNAWKSEALKTRRCTSPYDPYSKTHYLGSGRYLRTGIVGGGGQFGVEDRNLN